MTEKLHDMVFHNLCPWTYTSWAWLKKEGCNECEIYAWEQGEIHIRFWPENIKGRDFVDMGIGWKGICNLMLWVIVWMWMDGRMDSTSQDRIQWWTLVNVVNTLVAVKQVTFWPVECQLLREHPILCS